MTRKSALLASLLGGISALCYAMPAFAQTGSGTSQQAPTPALAPADAGAQEASTSVETAGAQVQDIIVTGSRVAQNGNDQPTPVTIVTTEQLLRTSPGNVIDAVQQLPSFAQNTGPSSNIPGNSIQNNAARTLNLRNIGVTRTLVLFDGKRIPPTLTGSIVNADIVPSMLLERVDIVTGGASAVYGSDAVSGVVNFITNRNFNGLKVEAQDGISQAGDGARYRAGIAAGHGFLDGRLHIEGSYEYFNQRPIRDRASRDFGRQAYSRAGVGTAANPYVLISQGRLSTSSFNGLITSGPLAGQIFTESGGLVPFTRGAATPSAGIESGGDGEYFKFSSLIAENRSHKAFSRVDFDITPDAHLYGEVVGMWTFDQNFAANVRFPGITISRENAFLTPAQVAALGTTQTFTFSKGVGAAGGVDPTSRTRGYLANIGVNGSFGGGWKWDLGYVRGQNRQQTYVTRNVDRQRALAGIDAVRDPTGNIVCRVTLTNPGLYPGCVPINVFGPNSENEQMLEYFLLRTQYIAVYKQNNFLGSITGSPFSTWAGPVQIAVSGEYRKLDYTLTSNAQPTERANCTGLRFNCTATTTRYQTNVIANATGGQEVSEGALEVNVPILKDTAVGSLNLSGAGRFTHYDTSGSVQTWKAGADWRLADGITLRATRSRDIRAPNVDELFAPIFIGPISSTDLHTNITGQINSVTTSNSSLVPERADTWTAGVVLRPGFLPGFSLAVDYYDIKINDAITSIAGASSTIQRICEDSNGTSPYCSLIVRPLPFSDRSPANFATSFISQPRNAQTFSTQGIDVEANYSATDVLGGDFLVRALVDYQPHLRSVQFSGAPTLDAAGVPPLAKVRGAVFMRLAGDAFSIDVQERFRSGYRYSADPALIFNIPDIKPAAYTNLTLTYALKDTGALKRGELFLTVENLLDRKPSVYGGNPGVPGLDGGFPQGDDPIGRYFTVGFRARL